MKKKETKKKKYYANKIKLIHKKHNYKKNLFIIDICWRLNNSFNIIQIKFWKVFLIIILFIKFSSQKKNQENNYGLSFEQKMKDYATKNFTILRRTECPDCGFFSFYVVHLGCIKRYLEKGYIPIIEMQSFKNIYNKGNKSVYNPWEVFFYQPYNYTLEEVKKYAKNVYRNVCTQNYYRPNPINIYHHNSSINFWHNFSKNYMPVKKVIMDEANLIMKKFFGNSKNILVVKLRGTNYVSDRPRGHSIQPTVEQIISDVKIFDEKYKYDYIFFTTEDNDILNKFVKAFDNKVKVLYPKDLKNITNYYESVNRKLSSVKIYLLDVIILSKCLDIIASKNSGCAGAFIMTEGFRHKKIYDFGVY